MPKQNTDPIPASISAFDEQKLFKTLVEYMNEMVWVVDRTDTTLYVNQRFCELMGYRCEDVIGRKADSFLSERGQAMVRRVNELDRAYGRSSSYEAEIVTAAGKHIPVWISGSPLEDGASIGIMTDLTELKKTQALHTSLVENMNEGVVMTDGEQRIRYANPRFCKMLGRPSNQVIGADSYSFLDDPSKERVALIDRSERKRGVSSCYEAVFVRIDGSRFPVLVNGTPLPDGGTIGIFTDLTELKRRETREKVLSGAISYASDAIIIANRSGKIESWNGGAKAIFGYSASEVTDRDLTVIFDKTDVEMMLGNSEIRYRFALKARHKNREELMISTTLSPLAKDDSIEDASFFLLIARDITAERKFEEELALKYQKMKEAYNQFGIVRRQIDYVFELADIAAQFNAPKPVADFVVNSVIMLTRVDACVLRVYNPSADTLDILSSFGVNENWSGKKSISFKESLAEQSFLQNRPIKVVDLTKEVRYTSLHLARNNNFCSLLTVALVFNRKPVGSLTLYVKPDKKLELFENDFIADYAKIVAMVLAKVPSTGGDATSVAH